MPQTVLSVLLIAIASSFLVGRHFKSGKYLNTQETLGTHRKKIVVFMFTWKNEQLN